MDFVFGEDSNDSNACFLFFFFFSVIELFGVETLQILGDLPENPPNKHDSGEESDSFSKLLIFFVYYCRKPAGVCQFTTVSTSLLKMRTFIFRSSSSGNEFFG